MCWARPIAGAMGLEEAWGTLDVGEASAAVEIACNSNRAKRAPEHLVPRCAPLVGQHEFGMIMIIIGIMVLMCTIMGIILSIIMGMLIGIIIIICIIIVMGIIIITIGIIIMGKIIIGIIIIEMRIHLCITIMGMIINIMIIIGLIIGILGMIRRMSIIGIILS